MHNTFFEFFVFSISVDQDALGFTLVSCWCLFMEVLRILSFKSIFRFLFTCIFVFELLFFRHRGWGIFG